MGITVCQMLWTAARWILHGLSATLLDTTRSLTPNGDRAKITWIGAYQLMANGCWRHKVVMAGHIPGVCARTSGSVLLPLARLKISGALTRLVAIPKIVPFREFLTWEDPSPRWSSSKELCAWQPAVVIVIDNRKFLGYSQLAMSSMANQTLGLDYDLR